MAASILDKIVAQRRLDVAAAKAITPIDVLRDRTNSSAPSVIDFHARLLQGLNQSARVAVIGEVKRASPSRGDIALYADAATIAVDYAHGGAAAISVLTEPTWFKGSLDDLSNARGAVEQAVGAATRPAFLRKDFIFDEYQIYEARLAGADTVLLIVACLTDDEIRSLMTISRGLGMEPLVEVNNASEMRRALDLGARVIGVNNRNLHNFTVDMNTTSSLAELVSRQSDVILAALSGISSRADVVPYEEQGVKAILVGEALMRSADKGAFLKSLIGSTN